MEPWTSTGKEGFHISRIESRWTYRDRYDWMGKNVGRDDGIGLSWPDSQTSPRLSQNPWMFMIMIACMTLIYSWMCTHVRPLQLQLVLLSLHRLVIPSFGEVEVIQRLRVTSFARIPPRVWLQCTASSSGFTPPRGGARWARARRSN